MPKPLAASALEALARGPLSLRLALGLFVRVAALLLLHDHAYVYDHLTYVYWGQVAVESGPLRLYEAAGQQRGPEQAPYRIYDGSNV